MADLEETTPVWFRVTSRKRSAQPLYARKGHNQTDGTPSVYISDGGMHRCVISRDYAQANYVLGAPLDDAESKRIEERYQWELHR